MIPNLPPGYIVGTEVCAIYGLRLTESDFLAGVLVQCEIELVNLTPNSILILAIFQHLCEGFLGILLLPSLFLHYYYLCRVRNVDQVFSGGVLQNPQESQLGVPLHEAEGLLRHLDREVVLPSQTVGVEPVLCWAAHAGRQLQHFSSRSATEGGGPYRSHQSLERASALCSSYHPRLPRESDFPSPIPGAPLLLY